MSRPAGRPPLESGGSTTRTPRYFPPALAAVLVVLVAANIAGYRLPGWSVVTGVALTAILAAIARWQHLSAAQLGLSRATAPAGLRWGGVFGAVVLVAYSGVLLVPLARTAVAGTGPQTWGEALLAALVVIPLGTIVPEEFAFRGVLWSLLRRRFSRGVATAGSSLLFGLWHVAPALGGGAANAAMDTVGGGTFGMLLRIVMTVVFTTFAGVVLCEMRARSDSLLAPAIAHWSVNGLGILFVHLA